MAPGARANPWATPWDGSSGWSRAPVWIGIGIRHAKARGCVKSQECRRGLAFQWTGSLQFCRPRPPQLALSTVGLCLGFVPIAVTATPPLLISLLRDKALRQGGMATLPRQGAPGNV